MVCFYFLYTSKTLYTNSKLSLYRIIDKIKSMFNLGDTRSNSNLRRQEGSTKALSHRNSKHLKFEKLFQYHAKKREESKISQLFSVTPKYIAKGLPNPDLQQGTPIPRQRNMKYLINRPGNSKLPNVLRTSHPKLSRLLSTSLNSKPQLALTKR